MAELETRLPCPVCIGGRMEKVRVAGSSLTLDRCGRCGGIWFEQGEVQMVRQLEQRRTRSRLGSSLDVSQAPCHACRAPFRRDAASCPACGHETRLACPNCDQPMTAATLDDLRLDVCSRCRGVWFDRHEIAAIWSARVDAVLDRRRGRNGPSADPHGGMLLEAFAYSPDLVFYGAYAGGELAASAGSALGDAAGAVGGAAEVAGEAAASVFEVIAGIIGGIFS